ncbi:MAG: hypothetical protein AB8G22_11985 [Saprospiraceae bacterium]
MSVFKNIKSLFVVEDAELVKKETGKSPTKSNTQPSRSKPAPAANSPVMPESTSGQPGKVSSKFMDVLLRSMEAADLDGFDYLEFKKSLQSLAKMPMDEATRYKSAFAMAQTMGVSPQKLIDSATHYINVLKREEDKFEKALAGQQSQQIGNKKQQIQQLDNLAKQKAEQIKKLTEEITQHQKQSEQLKKEIQDRTVKIETTKNDFIASFNALVAQIHGDVENMKQYLK